jgi:hypothetical protein
MDIHKSILNYYILLQVTKDPLYNQYLLYGMPTKHSEVCDSDDIKPFAEKFEVDNPAVHEGIFWCDECERELTTIQEDGSEVFVF